MLGMAKKSIVFDWHKRFKEGYKDVRNDGRSGNVEMVLQLMRSDRRLSTLVNAEKLDLDRAAVRKILAEDLERRKNFLE